MRAHTSKSRSGFTPINLPIYPSARRQPNYQNHQPPAQGHIDRSPTRSRPRVRPCATVGRGSPRLSNPLIRKPFQIPNVHSQPIDAKRISRTVHRGHPVALAASDRREPGLGQGGDQFLPRGRGGDLNLMALQISADFGCRILRLDRPRDPLDAATAGHVLDVKLHLPPLAFRRVRDQFSS